MSYKYNREKNDPKLGKEIRNYLIENHVETPIHDFHIDSYGVDKKKEIESHIQSILGILGLDLKDDSLMDTPKRISKMYVDEIFYGLNSDNFPKCTLVENKFNYDEMIIEKNITISSVCEHHFQPIRGSATIAYIPEGNVIGLSKMNRIADYFSRRPQVQERLTAQIFYALKYVLKSDNVAVVLDAEHGCVAMRGIEDVDCNTITSKLGGVFKNDPATRAEFMSLVRG